MNRIQTIIKMAGGGSGGAVSDERRISFDSLIDNNQQVENSFNLLIDTEPISFYDNIVETQDVISNGDVDAAQVKSLKVTQTIQRGSGDDDVARINQPIQKKSIVNRLCSTLKSPLDYIDNSNRPTSNLSPILFNNNNRAKNIRAPTSQAIKLPTKTTANVPSSTITTTSNLPTSKIPTRHSTGTINTYGTVSHHRMVLLPPKPCYKNVKPKITSSRLPIRSETRRNTINVNQMKLYNLDEEDEIEDFNQKQQQKPQNYEDTNQQPPSNSNHNLFNNIDYNNDEDEIVESELNRSKRKSTLANHHVTNIIHEDLTRTQLAAYFNPSDSEKRSKRKSSTPIRLSNDQSSSTSSSSTSDDSSTSSSSSTLEIRQITTKTTKRVVTTKTKSSTSKSTENQSNKTTSKNLFQDLRQQVNKEENLISKSAFCRLVKELIRERTLTDNFRITQEALDCLKQSSELFMIIFFHDLNLSALHSKRKTVKVDDINFLRSLKEYKFICSI